MSKRLYQKSVDTYNKASKEQKINSKHQVKINNLNVQLHVLLYKVIVYKKIMFNMSRFSDILEEKYPKIYDEIKKESIKKFGKCKRKKELLLEEINKIKSNSKGKFLIKRLKKRFNIKEELKVGEKRT